jgi:thioredoxin-related protein
MKCLLTFILIATVYTVQAQGINFEKGLDWKQIQAKAKSENKYIFLDAYATWCGPCKAMSDEVFTNKEIGDFINDSFISVKVQMDQTKDDDESVKSWYAEARSIGEQYKVTAYPTILFFSPDGKPAGRSVGYKDAPSLITGVKKAMVNAEEFRWLHDRYSSGMRDSALIKRLAVVGKKTGQNELAEKIAQQYIGSLNDRELFKKDNLVFVQQFTTSSTDIGFKLFRTESKKVNSVLGANAAERKLREIVGKEEVIKFLKDYKSIPDWESMEKTVKNKYGTIGLETYYGERMSYALNREDWTNFGKYYALYYSTACSRSGFHINNMSWSVVEQVSDPVVLETAIKTMKYDIEHFDQHNLQAYDTYANLLYKAGKKQEAIEWESKAARIEEENASKNNGKPDPVYAETLEKMKKGRDEPCPSSRR